MVLNGSNHVRDKSMSVFMKNNHTALAYDDKIFLLILLILRILVQFTMFSAIQEVNNNAYQEPDN
jgi:hypothetical protein